MEMNLFEGLRTLAANVAVEMPESEVGGSKEDKISDAKSAERIGVK